MESAKFLPKAGHIPALAWEPWKDLGLKAQHVDGHWYTIYGWQQLLPKGSIDKPWRLSFNIDIIGTFDSAEEAKKYADEHHAKTHRANLWAKYMAENDPPDA